MSTAEITRPDLKPADNKGPRSGGSPYQELKFAIHRRLLDRINLEAVYAMPADRVRPEIRPSVAKLINEEKTPLSLTEKEKLIEEVLDEVFGLGPLEPLLRDKTVSDILVTTPHLIYVERMGKLERTDIEFKDDAHLLRIIERVVSRVGRRIDESSPMVDARLPDGSRVNAVIPPLAVDGPLLSIRRFGGDPLQPADLLRKLSLTEGMLELLKACVKARLNIIISGGTGAGKTTFLNMLSGFIPSGERIVTIEDAAELQLRQSHVARMETRPANIEGKGAVAQRQLLINALRMRPDRIIVGEVRGEEALDMLQAMNTGHDGSLTTVHANTPRDAISRMETMSMMGNILLPEKAIKAQISSAVNLIVQVARLSDGTRRITHISELTGAYSDAISMNELFVFDKQGLGPQGKIKGRFRSTGILPNFFQKLAATGIPVPTDLIDHSVEV